MSLPPAAIVLAGERPGGNALARAHHVPSALTMELLDRPLLDWALTAVTDSGIERTLLVGPSPELAQVPAVQRWADRADVDWIAPAAGPAASVVAAAERAAQWPLLLTAADHALLQPHLLQDFCAKAARQSAADVVVGMVPAERVRERFPDSRRTWLRFRDGACCGSNLFYLRNAAALRVLRFWQQLEALRKQPWRMAARIGPTVLLRYVLGWLDREAALAHVGRRCDARIQSVLLETAELAVDVDSPDDFALAERVLRERATATER